MKSKNSNCVDVSYLVFLYRMAVKHKGIKTSLVGRRAELFLKKLTEKYAVEDLVKIISSLGKGVRFELFWLLNEETFRKYLKGAEDSLRLNSSPGIFGKYDHFTHVYEYYLKPFVPKLKNREATYQDFLRSIFEKYDLDESIQVWLAVDVVFRIACKAKIFVCNKLKPLKDIFRKRSFFEGFVTEYLVFVKKKGLWSVIKEELEVLLEYINGNDKLREKAGKILREYGL